MSEKAPCDGDDGVVQMIGGCSIAAVVPAYDEEDWIREVIATMPPFVDRVIVVDDCSRDGTAKRASETASAAIVEVIRHDSNAGVGAAIASGYRRALACGADVVVVMAGDGQMDPADLAAIVEPIVAQRADYVKGNRLRHPDVWRAMPRTRLIGSLVLSALTSAAVGLPVRDSQCGYTAIARRQLERIDLDSMWPRFGYPNDLLATILRSCGRVEEVTVRPVYRGERSHLRIHHLGAILYLIGRAGWRRMTMNGAGHAERTA
jgi:glycosyltransferase involved in cell wall biosynthesis